MRVENEEENEKRAPKEEHKNARFKQTVPPRSPFRDLILLFLLSFLLSSCIAAGPYGTDNGYDNEGGTEPICWDSRVRWDNARVAPNSTQHLNDNFDKMNAKLFANDSTPDELNVTLRTSCYEGTNLTVIPNNMKHVSSLGSPVVVCSKLAVCDEHVLRVLWTCSTQCCCDLVSPLCRLAVQWDSPDRRNLLVSNRAAVCAVQRKRVCLSRSQYQ